MNTFIMAFTSSRTIVLSALLTLGLITGCTPATDPSPVQPALPENSITTESTQPNLDDTNSSGNTNSPSPAPEPEITPAPKETLAPLEPITSEKETSAPAPAPAPEPTPAPVPAPEPTPAPSATIQQHATAATLTARALELLISTQPEIGPASLISTNCTNTNAGEGSNILGCYTTGLNRIYIFDITDSRVAQAETVVVAHELLHAVWFTQLTREQRDTLTNTLYTYFNALPSNHYLRDRLNVYADSPASIPTELHSILGTEAPNLPAALETHYAQYFTNRNAVVQQAQNTFEYVHNLENEARDAAREISTQLTRLDTRQTQLETDNTTLNNDIRAFNDAVNNGEYGTQTEYEAARAELEQRQTQLDADYATFNQAIRDYNALIDAYNQKVTLINQLNQALSTTPLKTS